MNIKRHISYLKYVLIHKWFVFIAGLKTSAPLWRLLVHDWQKFLPCEWFTYAYTFYDKCGRKRFLKNPKFDFAWNHHQKACKHHWQYWVLIRDGGNLTYLDIPESYVREMVADWMGAGRAITGKWDIHKWYDQNKNNILLSDNTRKFVEKILATI
jgi:hypothetical protein